MKRLDCDVAIVGAGVAGLAAAGTLSQAGKSVVCLDARDRIGGRIFTVHDPLTPVAIELGAEFVHGRPPQLQQLIRDSGLLCYERSPLAWHFHNGRAQKEKQVGEVANQVLEKMAKSRRKTDKSFEDYLRRSDWDSRPASWSRVQIEGFNAANRGKISAASLAEDGEAAEKIDGDRIFRLPSGYDAVATALLGAISDHASAVRLNNIVHAIKWRRGSVHVLYRAAIGGGNQILRCRRVIVTVPLGVMKAAPSAKGTIRFDPLPRSIMRAAARLEVGEVYRVTFRFRDAFWEDDKKLRQTGFLVSAETPFMTWWTAYPVIAPVITGWSAGTRAEGLREADQHDVADEALRSLSRILRRRIPPPEGIWFHDWQTDPFARGAYSYVPVGATRKALSVPVEDTLYFAGEAANREGRGGTVDGAIQSGMHAAELIRAARNR